MQSSMEAFHFQESDTGPMDDKENVWKQTRQELAKLAGQLPTQPANEFVSAQAATPMEYRGEPLTVPLRGMTTINFQGNGASIRLPRSDWFCAEVRPTPPLRELWGNDAHCDGQGAIVGRQTNATFVMRPGQNEAVIAFWSAANLDANDRQRFQPLFAIRLVRQPT